MAATCFFTLERNTDKDETDQPNNKMNSPNQEE